MKIMRRLILELDFFRIKFLFFFLSLIACDKKKNISTEISNMNFDSNHIYLFFRETQSKNGIIAKSYNKYGSVMSHIGVGIYSETSGITIYHILEKEKKIKNDIWKSKINDFYNNEVEKVSNGEVWKSVDTISSNNIKKIESLIDSIQNSKTKFDLKFDFADHSKMYCSEFVYYTLKDIKKFESSHPHLFKTKLVGLKKTFVGKSEIEFLPVDFLYPNKNFVRIYSSIK